MGSNLEKIKQLGAEISSREEKDASMKMECLSCLEKIKSMLCKTRTNKQELKEEVEKLISKLS
jgi:hypothetical protein